MRSGGHPARLPLRQGGKRGEGDAPLGLAFPSTKWTNPMICAANEWLRATWLRVRRILRSGDHPHPSLGATEAYLVMRKSSITPPDSGAALPRGVGAPRRAAAADHEAPDTESAVQSEVYDLSAALRAMPPITRAIFALHVHHAMSITEIANRFGISRRSIRRHVRSAIAVVARQRPLRVTDRAGDAQ